MLLTANEKGREFKRQKERERQSVRNGQIDSNTDRNVDSRYFLDICEAFMAN